MNWISSKSAGALNFRALFFRTSGTLATQKPFCLIPFFAESRTKLLLTALLDACCIVPKKPRRLPTTILGPIRFPSLTWYSSSGVRPPKQMAWFHRTHLDAIMQSTLHRLQAPPSMEIWNLTEYLFEIKSFVEIKWTPLHQPNPFGLEHFVKRWI